MAKPKLSDFKKLLAEMTEVELRTEMLKLFNKLEQVQMFYAQDLMSKEDRTKILEECKSKIYKKFWAPSGNPRNNIKNAEIRKIITDFEKISAFPHEVVDLLLYRSEAAIDYMNDLGGMADADYNAAATAFEKALKLIVKHQLADHFKKRCNELLEKGSFDYFESDYLDAMFENDEDD